MARVTEAEVLAIMDTTLVAADITVFVTSANVMVDAVLGTGTTNILKEIERWLAAHMASVTLERTAKKEEAGGAKIEYTGKFGDILKQTSYGQMVLALDTTGKMAEQQGIIKTASITAVTSFS